VAVGGAENGFAGTLSADEDSPLTAAFVVVSIWATSRKRSRPEEERFGFTMLNCLANEL
jgi:hypothetical protein